MHRQSRAKHAAGTCFRPKRVSKKAAAAAAAAAGEDGGGSAMDVGEDSAAPSGEASEPSLLQRITGAVVDVLAVA